MKKQTKKQLKESLIKKLSNFDKIEWKYEYFDYYIHSYSRAEALRGDLPPDHDAQTHGKLYSTKLKGYSIGLYLHNSPEEDYKVLAFKGSLPFDPLYGTPDLELNKKESKQLCKLVDKQVQTYLAQEKEKEEEKEEKAEIRSEQRKRNKKELKTLKILLK